MRFKIIKASAILYRFQKYQITCTQQPIKYSGQTQEHGTGDSGRFEQSGNKYHGRL